MVRAARVMGLLLLAGALCVAPDAHASILSAIAKAAKAAGAASKAGKAARGVKVAKTGLVAGGATVAAERAGLLFKLVPDEVGSVAVYVGREPSGAYRVVSRSGQQATHGADELAGALSSASGDGSARLTVYVDATAALEPAALPKLGERQRLFVLDGEARPHRVRVEADGDGVVRHLVDVGDTTLDLADFAAAVVGDDDDPPSPVIWAMTGGVALATGIWLWLRRRRRQTERAVA